MEKEWTIRQYEEGDEIKIKELKEAVYQKDWENIFYWNWKYKENSAGFYKDIIWVAEDKTEDKIVGHYTIIPVYIKIGKKTILGSQSVDTATHPDYRRQGIFEVLAKKCYQSAWENGISVTYGFASEGPSYYGFLKKLDWVHICFLREMLHIINIDRFNETRNISVFRKIIEKEVLKLKKSPKIDKPNDIEFSTITKFDDRIDAFWKEVSQNYHLIIKRDKSFLNWRISNPSQNYQVMIAEKGGKIVAYTIFVDIIEKGRKKGVIVDLLALNRHTDAAEYLLYLVKENYIKNKIDFVISRIPESHDYYTLFKKLGFSAIKTRMGFIGRTNHPKKFFRDEIADIEKWFVTFCDSDHI